MTMPSVLMFHDPTCNCQLACQHGLAQRRDGGRMRQQGLGHSLTAGTFQALGLLHNARQNAECKAQLCLRRRGCSGFLVEASSKEKNEEHTFKVEPHKASADGILSRPNAWRPVAPHIQG